MAHEYVKISELEPTTSFGTTDQFVIVQNEETVKIDGASLVQSLATLTNLATRSYVDAVVDSAPGTLDTLRELAAALNDDSNFGANITTLINEKLPTSNFGLEFWNQLATVNTYHIQEGSNLYWTQDRFEAAWATKNTYHLAEGSNLYFTNERARAGVFDGDDLINFDNGGQVGNAQLKHEGSSFLGMDLYSPGSHEWVQLNFDDTNYVWVSSSSAGIDITAADGTYKNWIFNDNGDLKLPPGGDILDADGNSVLNVTPPVIVTNLDGLTDVQITNPSANQVLKFNGSVWVNGNDDSGTGGGSYPTAPTFTSVTATQLNVQNVAFTGTGAVTIASGNDLNLVAAGNVTVNGDLVITKTQLKSIVAASTDFADFKARIAAL